MTLVPKLQKYTTASPIIATFNFTDIADGTGVQLFNCLFARSGETINAILNQTALKTEQVSFTLSGVEDTTPSEDFDLTAFNFTKTVRGTVYIIGNYAYAENVNERTSFLRFDLIKWDGATETVIGTVNGETGVDVSLAEREFTLTMTTNQTTLAQGDILRLKITAVITGTTSETESVWTIKTDPQTAGNELKIYIPFDTNL